MGMASISSPCACHSQALNRLQSRSFFCKIWSFVQRTLYMQPTELIEVRSMFGVKSVCISFCHGPPWPFLLAKSSVDHIQSRRGANQFVQKIVQNIGKMDTSGVQRR